VGAGRVWVAACEVGLWRRAAAVHWRPPPVRVAQSGHLWLGWQVSTALQVGGQLAAKAAARLPHANGHEFLTHLQASMIVNARWEDWSEDEDATGAAEVGGSLAAAFLSRLITRMVCTLLGSKCKCWQQAGPRPTVRSAPV